VSPIARLLSAVAVWLVTAALGWWWQQPPAAPTRTPAAAQTVDPLPTLPGGNTDDTLARRVAAADPMGLTRIADAAQQRAEGTGPGAMPADAVVWTLAALVVRGAERFAVLTAPAMPPMRVAQGGQLPDGDRIKQIAPDRIVLQSPRGKLRTIYLTEP